MEKYCIYRLDLQIFKKLDISSIMLMEVDIIMNRKILFGIGLSTLLAGTSLAVIFRQNNKVEKVEAYEVSALPTTIDLNDTSNADIRTYYSSLNNLSESERQGENLLKNLKTILKNGQKYYSYDTGSPTAGISIWRMYEITDRDWEKSPAGSDTYGTYNPATNVITNYAYGTSKDDPKNNPYLHALYVDRTVENEMRAWLYNGAVSHGGNGEWCIDREHLWQKSQGFEANGKGGARGDPMHLWAGDSYVNSALHNDQFYGYVDFNQEYTDGADKWSYTGGNYLGYSLTMQDTKGSGVEKVFEPQDSDKGDIARALLYMVARYNFLSGSDSDGIDSNNPNLEVVQDSQKTNAYTSTESITGKIGILTDLLAWHHADPVDEYEIHRNNLLYTNYTNNRNPFIDFPEWVDYIWGTARYNGREFRSYSPTPTGYAKPGTDKINGYNDHEVVNVTGVSLNVDEAEIVKGNTLKLNETVLPSNATNPDVTWSSSNNAIASVNNNGLVTANAYGDAVITVTTLDGGFTATCAISVVPTSITATVNKTFLVGDIISKSDITVKTDTEQRVTDFDFDSYQFTYSDAASGGALTNKTFANAISYQGKTCSLTVQVQREAYETITEPATDTLNKVFTGSPGTNSYVSWSGKSTGTSNAVYAGNNAGGNDSIQLRKATSEPYAGIVTTTSGGVISSVVVDWNSAGTGTGLAVYGKNSAYSTPNDLYDTDKCGTLLGTITKGDANPLVVTGSYLYVGITSAGGAIYLNSVTFNFGKDQYATNVANFVMFEDTVGQCSTKTDTAIGYFNELSSEEKTTFMTSDDYVITQGRERFEAWLRNQGKSINPSTYVISGLNYNAANSNSLDSNVGIIIIVMASVSSLALATLLVIKKRKYHK